MSITRQERERFVLDLYYNQGKNIREIAQEARMSFRDIGAILNKADERREQNNNNNISLPGITHYPASYMYGGEQQQCISSQDYFTEHYSGMLLNEAEKLYNKLVNEITMGITYDPAFSSSTSSTSPFLSPSSEGTTTKSSSTPAKSIARY
jgi:hypothetical protein